MAESYSSLTVNDPNRIKRALHRRRLGQAVRRMEIVGEKPDILDFGAGNGELAHYLLQRHKDAQVTVYEPAEYLMKEARANLSNYGSRIQFAASI